MGIWSSVRGAFFGAPGPVAEALTFADDGPSIHRVIEYGDVASLFPGPQDWTGPAWKVGRPQAMQCGAIVRARDAICTTIGSLPLYAMGADYTRSTRELLDQPEVGIPRSVTMTRTVEDLQFGGFAYWRVTKRDYSGFPTKVRRLDLNSVNVREDQRVYVRPDGTPQGNATEYVPDRDLIRFYSPKDGLLTTAARAIRILAKLDAADSNAADSPAPRGFFTPAEGADPAEDDDIRAMLADWRAARQQGVDGYVPAALKYNTASYSPAELGLVAARNSAVLEIARFTGLDPSDLAADAGSQNSMTYANVQDKRRQFIDGPCAGFITAIQDRLSMGDVTPRGTQVRIDVAQYERADMSGRLEEYQLMRQLGLIDRAEILRSEERPTPTEDPMPAPTAQPAIEPGRPALRAISASSDELHTFSDEPDGVTVGFAADPVSVDVEARTIRGLAVPWGAVATKNGRRFSFARGSVVWPEDIRRVKVLRDHNRAAAVGRVVELTEDETGLHVVLRISPGQAGNEALALAEDGVLDGLSIGVSGEFERRDGIDHARPGGAHLAEVTLTGFPAFDSARISSVAASADDLEVTMPCSSCGQVHAAGTPCATAPAPTTGPVTFSTEQFAELIGHFGNPQQGPEVIPAVPAGTAQVTESALYRFDGSKGEHDFSADLIEWSLGGSGEAAQRVSEFMTAQFNVAQADVASLNPTKQRTDLYVDNLELRYPVWSAIVKGTLEDVTTFRIPKFNTASGLVADHAAGVEPSAGSFTTTYQDITPTGLSGKVVINREVWDQGGSPQLSQLLWNEVQRAWYEGLEKKAVDMLDALTPTAIALSGVDADLAGVWSDALADLQYIRGGYRFDDFVMAKNLFKGFTGAVDDDGRRLYPMINPANANGQTDRRFRFIDADGVQGVPAWALEAANGGEGSSYLFCREDVHGWATPPQRIDMPAIAVATVTIGIWGRVATACTRLEGVREVTYSG